MTRRLTCGQACGLLAGMSKYTIALQMGDSPATSLAVVDVDSIADAKDKAFAIFQRSGVKTGYVALGRGEGDSVDWIGAFDFEPDSAPRWEADS